MGTVKILNAIPRDRGYETRAMGNRKMKNHKQKLRHPAES